MTHKMKRLLITGLAGMLFAGFASCSQDVKRGSDPQMVDELVSPSLEGITFSLRLSGQAPKLVQTRADKIHDAQEWAIKQFQIFVFDSDGKFVERLKVEGTELQQGAAPTYTYKSEGKLSVDKNKVLQFFFLANSDDITSLTTSSTLQGLKDLVLTKQQTVDPKSILTSVSGADYIPMTGMAMIGGSTFIPYTKGMQASVDLTRVVARIDIVNRIPELKITEISLHNAYTKSRVASSTAENDRFSGAVKPYKPLPGGGLVGIRSAAGARLDKAFYLYEGVNNQEDKCVYVRIKGELEKDGSTKIYFYNIPFKTKQFGADAGALVPVKRNHRYTIILGDKTAKGKVDFTFGVEDWTLHTLFEPFSPVMATAPKNDAVYTYKSTGMGTGTLSFVKAGGTATLTLSCSIEGHTTFNIEGVKPAWLTSAQLSGDGNKTLTIVAPQNDESEDQKGTLVVVSDKGEKLTLDITQAH